MVKQCDTANGGAGKGEQEENTHNEDERRNSRVKEGRNSIFEKGQESFVKRQIKFTNKNKKTKQNKKA